jgi:GTP-binding protein HflX
VTDTVGFIRRLPHDLVEGFAATLEETLSAELVLHVLDASAPDDELDRMIAAVDDVLAEIGAAELPIELVLNKIDAVDPLARRRLANRFPGAVPHGEGAKLAELYSLGTPIDEREDTEEGVVIRARLPRRELSRFAPYLIAETEAPSTATTETHRASR